MTKNNLSRKVFKQVAESMGCKKDQYRNAMWYKNKLFGFVLVDSFSDMSCRQFYEDYSGVIFYNQTTGSSKVVMKDNLSVSKSPTRISPKGLKAFNAEVF